MKNTSYGFNSATATIGLSMILATSAAIGATYFHANAGKQLVELENERYLASTFANMLQLSSDNLTNMSRIYVVTGDPRFRDYFDQVSNIRNGLQAIPENYNDYYWNFVFAGEIEADPLANGKKISWRELAEQDGFTPEEITELNKAYMNSEQLVRIEDLAMNLVAEASSELSGDALKNDSRMRRAFDLLYSDEYYEQKAFVSHPLKKFNTMWKARLANDIEKYRQQERIAGLALGVSLLVMFGILITCYTAIVRPMLKLASAIKNRKQFEIKSQGVLGTREIASLIEDYNELLSSLRNEKETAVARSVELEESNQKLKESNVELEISEFKRRQKSEKLEQTLSDLNMFMRITSHDLSAPIKNIATLSDALLKKECNFDDATKTRFLGNINNSSNRLLKLIRDLRILTKMDSQEKIDTQGIEFEPTNVSEIFQSIIDEYKLNFDISSANYVKNSATEELISHSSLFRQLLENLIRNALLHGAKPAEIRLTHRQIGPDHFFTMINRCKEGFIFDPEVVKPFKRGANAYEDGTGLGLYICQKVVEIHQGEIGVFATDDNEFGVEFIIRRKENVQTDTEGKRTRNTG